MTDPTPRIMLIHALRESQVPAWRAFEAGWPQARIFNLLDDSLSADVAAAGKLTDDMIERFLTLGRYAAGTGADAIQFTCSAFGPAIEAVKRDLSIPVFSPSEAAFEAALEKGSRIGLMVTFPVSLKLLGDEMTAIAAQKGKPLDIHCILVEGAIAALQSGNTAEHDRLALEAAKKLPALDALVLGQFSLAHMAKPIAEATGLPVFTTPDSAVTKLRGLF
ncbi:aspartate/glutamate racemase family protein [Oceanibaculum sp.]|uniref:aspartate/glutamate racemase family protein n=1 Tax=Oceanibaculum sp. TaxID=1903597 RepID=UPI00258E0BFB|nr:aspartate/glutamate racemase family protein [Oceanibaculum sp.]MCH2394490.1 aspartate/glutamate racemase family protein [Oceanibaculum sp.]